MYRNYITQQFKKTLNQTEALQPTKIHFMINEYKTSSNELLQRHIVTLCATITNLL